MTSLQTLGGESTIRKAAILFFIIFIASFAKTNAWGQGQPAPVIDCQITYKYFGDSFSSKFHRPSCVFAAAISPRHLVLFQFRRQAIAAHYQPCRYCLPPVWLSVHAVILGQPPQLKPSNLKATDNKAENKKADNPHQASGAGK